MPPPEPEPTAKSPEAIRVAGDRATMERIDTVARGLVAAFQDADPVLTAAALRRAADMILRRRPRESTGGAEAAAG